MDTQGLATRAIRGVFWTGGAIAAQLVITFLFFRFLPLETMGQFHWALTVAMLGAMVASLGLGEALVQLREAGESHFNAAFWGGLVSGLSVAAILLVAGPFLSARADDPEGFRSTFVPLVGMVPFAAVSGVFRSRLQRALHFRAIALAEVAAVAVAGLAAVLLLFGGFGVWSPVVNALAREASLLAGLWLASRWSPRFRFSWTSFRALWGVGLNVTGSNGLNYVSNRLDHLVVFYMLGDRALGHYAFAFRFTMFPLTRAAMILTRVSFPTFSRIQDDNVLLKRGYLSSVTGIALLSWPALAGLWLFAPEALLWVKGIDMLPALPVVRLLIAAGMLKAVGTVVGSILLAKGKAHWSFRWTLVNLAVMVPALYVGSRYGVQGVATVVALSVLLFLFVTQFLVNHLIDLDFSAYGRALVRPLGITVLVAGALTGLRLWIDVLSQTKVGKFKLAWHAVLLVGVTLQVSVEQET